MARINYYRVFIGILFSLFLTSFAFATYPDIEFTQTSFGSGQVDINARSSSGTQVELYVNDNYIGQKDVFAPTKTVVLDGTDITNQQIALGQTITFVNEDFKTYQLNFSGETIKTLNPGDSVSYTGKEIGQIYYRDETSGIQRTIDISDQLTEFNFTDVTTYLTDGSNTLKFKLKYPYPTFEQTQEEIFTANYEKFPNTIYVTNFTNITDTRRVSIKGSVADSRYPLYYLLNIAPEGVGNTGALTPIDLTGSSFETSVGSLREGLNNIYLITTDISNSNVFTGQKTLKVTVDTIAPDIDITSVKYRAKGATVDTVLNDIEEDMYINGQSLILNVTTDAETLNYTYNNQNLTATLDNGTAMLDLSLQIGQNNLTLIAIDKAGNINKEAHNIHFDDRMPELIDETLEPEEMFKGSSGTARFFFQNIEGKTNKPSVEMTIFTLPEDAKDFDGNPVTCENYRPIFVRSLGQLDSETPDYPELNLEEYQMSLTALMFQKVTTTSDGNGEFDALIGLQEKTFDRGDYNDARNENEQVDTVKSRNQICFVLVDRFGNINIDSKRVTLDAGNTMWRAAEITTIPNTLYAAEIAQAGDVRAGSGNVEFAMIVNFDYIGPGEVTHLNSLTVGEDIQISEHSKYIVLDKSRMNYMLNKDTGKLVVHIPVKILPIKNLEPVDYPEELKFGFYARMSYSVDDTDIPIDEKNPIYFQTSINVERPLDHTKWLTPKMIDKWVGYLNKTIDFTETAVDWTGKASIVGVIACTGSKFWYGIKMATDNSEEAKNDAKKTMFTICDRVACTASPQRCEGDFVNTDDTGNGIFAPPEGTKTGSYLQGETLQGDAMIYNNYEDGDKLAQFDTLKIGQPCDYKKDGIKNDGVMVSGKVTKYEEEGGAWSYTATAEGMVTDFCAPASYSVEPEFDANGNLINANEVVVDKINLQGASGACFHEGAPKFDETRCMIPGLESSGAAGWDPSDNVFESIRCGCITDTYSHLKNYLKIMQSIRGCLQQAKLGEVKGSYCERLISQAVCDIATNVIFKTISQKSTRGGADGEDPHDNVFLDGIQGLKEGDKILNKRYEGTFYSKAGLGSEQIVNKMCMVAISGDWSVLTDNILASIDQNQVEPIFGPMIPESRIQGYNPLTGDLSIQYRFTYAGVSGGQDIRSYIEFICDSEAPGGEYCPPGYHTSKELRSKFNVKTLYIRKGGSAQDTVVVTDTKARYRYNLLKITHKYELKGESKEKNPDPEQIFAKGEIMIANCYWSAGVQPGSTPGITCDTLFNNDALLSAYEIDTKQTKLVPNTANTFFPGNSVFLDLSYDIRTKEHSTQTSFDLAYVATCPAVGENAKAVKKGIIPVPIPAGTMNSGKKVLELFSIPSLGEAQTQSFSKLTLSLDNDDLTDVWDTTTNSLKPEYQDANAKLIFYNLNGVTANAFMVKSAPGIDTAKYDGIIGQSLNVNAQSISAARPQEESFDIPYTAIVSNSGTIDLTLNFADKVENLAVVIQYGNGKSRLFSTTSIEGASEYEFDKLREGTCTLEAKLLPSGQGQSAIADIAKFKDYSPLGDEIQVDPSMKSQNYYKTSFTLAKSSTPTASFALITPYDSYSLCLDESDSSIPITYVMQTSDNENPEIAEVNYKLTLTRKTGTLAGTINLQRGTNTYEITDGIQNFVSTIKGDSVQEGKLTYDVILKTKNQNEIKRTESIDLHIRYPPEGSDCNDFSIYGTQSYLEKQQEETGTEGEEADSNEEKRD